MMDVFDISRVFASDVAARFAAVCGPDPDVAIVNVTDWLVYLVGGQPVMAVRKPDLRNLRYVRWVIFDLD